MMVRYKNRCELINLPPAAALLNHVVFEYPCHFERL